ncbi:MAG: ABC transporter permease [Oscillospiraceae bacterium]|jgi:multidrug/hemolysin transport system permease protein|nr:ABC transporter permease [Oscillospiraceae bacterium]
MTALWRRNLLVFFRDRVSVFFSFLGVIVIIGLYVLFLGDLMLSDMSGIPGSRFLMDSWIMAGMLAATGVTTTLGALGTMVTDRAQGITRDLSATPISRRALAGSYVAGAYVIGVLLTLVSLVFAELYIVAYGGRLLPAGALCKLLGLILLSVFASSGPLFFLTTFLKSTSAFATVSTILGTLIGFLTGIYIPIGSLPAAVQFVVKAFPISHAGVLFRQVMMEVPLAASFAAAPPEALSDFRTEMGVVFLSGETEIPWGVSVLILLATGFVFYLLSVARLSKKRD